MQLFRMLPLPLALGAALAAGAFSLLHKPVAPDLLRFTVQRLLEQHFRRTR